MRRQSSSVAPHGGTKRVFGTNPFAYAAPAGKELGIVFDAASSVAAAGKLLREAGARPSASASKVGRLLAAG